MTAHFPAPYGEEPGQDVDAHVRDAPVQDAVPAHRVSPLVPLRSTAHRGREHAARAGRVVGVHAGRVPLYVLRLVLRSPVGVWRLLLAFLGWVSDDEGRKVRRSMSAPVGDPETPEAQAFVRVQAQHRETQWLRVRLVFIGGCALVLVALLAALLHPVNPQPWHLAAFAAVVVVGLGVCGRAEDTFSAPQHLTGGTGTPMFTADLIVDALGALGLAELNKALKDDPAGAIRFVGPVHRDGEGWRADLDLPGGVTAGDVIDRRDRLASGLRRPEGCVWPEADPDSHAGRLILWVGDRPMSRTTPMPWPLARAGKVNLFEAFPIGVDQRGRAVDLTLMFASMAVGAVPRQGKTAALRLLLLAAALDPRAEVHVHNLKGGGDLDALDAVAHYCRAGDEDEDLDALLDDLRAVRADMRRRYKTIRELPREVCPDSKITDELASRRSLGLHPVVVGIDECQIAFEHSRHGKEFEEVVTDLVKRGPAVGISVIVATQRPDAKSLPSGIRANAILRFCLRVTDQQSNDMVLGTSAYKAGIRATMFSRRDVGVGYLVGDGDDPVIVRAAYIDTPTAAVIAARARAARERAGLLTGQAAGETAEPAPAPNVLDDALTLWPADRPRLRWEELSALLTDAGHDLTPEAVSATFRGAGVPTVQVKRTEHGQQTNRAGCARDAVTDAVAAR